MKILFASLLPILISLLFSPLAWASSSAPHAHENFLQCISLHFPNSNSIAKVIYTPYNSSYISVLDSSGRNRRFITAATPKPQVIVTPLGPLQETHIQAAIYCSKEHGLNIRVRSGGHDYEGLSYVSYELPFVVIDLVNFQSVDVDVENRTAWVQAGVTLGQLYYRIAEKSETLGFSAGVCPTVGVGGHFSGNSPSIDGKKTSSPYTDIYFKGKSDYVTEPISENGLQQILRSALDLQVESFQLQFSPYGGRMSEISTTETPFAHRAGILCSIHYGTVWEEEGEVAFIKNMENTRMFYSSMAPYVSKSPRSAYLNYRDLDLGVNLLEGNTSYEQASVWGLKYYGINFKRLVQVKTMVDPGNFFRNEQSIPAL
ncbi:hypothetical protein U1Q18_010025 [Sarracenia purpurea var. burkii]